MKTIKFTAPIDPIPFPRPAQNGKRRFNPPHYTAYKNALGLFARRAMNGLPPLSGAVRISVDVYRKIDPTSLKFGDWDNHGKAVSDALNGICYFDDRQIVRSIVELFKGEPKVIVTLEELE